MWLCRQANDAEQSLTVFGDKVIVEASSILRERAAELVTASERFPRGRRELMERGRGILGVTQRAQRTSDVPALVRLVLGRHAEIQRAKIDQGRPKRPWIEECGSEFVLTSGRIGTRSAELTVPEDIRGLDWRFNAAFSLLSVTGRLDPAVAT